MTIYHLKVLISDGSKQKHWCSMLPTVAVCHVHQTQQVMYHDSDAFECDYSE